MLPHLFNVVRVNVVPGRDIRRLLFFLFLFFDQLINPDSNLDSNFRKILPTLCIVEFYLLPRIRFILSCAQPEYNRCFTRSTILFASENYNSWKEALFEVASRSGILRHGSTSAPICSNFSSLSSSLLILFAIHSCCKR